MDRLHRGADRSGRVLGTRDACEAAGGLQSLRLTWGARAHAPHLASHHVPALPNSEQDQVNSRCSVECVEEIVASKVGFSCPEPHLFCSHRYLHASAKFCPVATWSVSIILVMSRPPWEVRGAEGGSVLIPPQSGRHPH